MTRTTIHTAAAALLVAACSGASPTGDADAQTTARSARPLELAGVRPGMTIDEVTAVLKARGFTVTIASPARSFENAVANEVAAIKGAPGSVDSDFRGVGELNASKLGETVTVLFPAPTPGGGTVINVGYQADLGIKSEAAVRAEVIARYGQPTRVIEPQELRWCAASDPCVASRNTLPSLSYSGKGRIAAFLTVHGGLRVEEAARQRLTAEVRRRVGTSASSF